MSLVKVIGTKIFAYGSEFRDFQAINPQSHLETGIRQYIFIRLAHKPVLRFGSGATENQIRTYSFLFSLPVRILVNIGILIISTIPNPNHLSLTTHLEVLQYYNYPGVNLTANP